MIIRTTIYTDQINLNKEGIISQTFEDENHMNAEEICDILGYFTVHGPTELIRQQTREKLRAALAEQDYEEFYEILRHMCKALRNELRNKSGAKPAKHAKRRAKRRYMSLSPTEMFRQTNGK